jgi:hypothetical protein
MIDDVLIEIRDPTSKLYNVTALPNNPEEKIGNDGDINIRPRGFPVCSSHNIYTASHPRRRYSSQSPLWKHQILLIGFRLSWWLIVNRIQVFYATVCMSEFSRYHFRSLPVYMHLTFKAEWLLYVPCALTYSAFCPECMCVPYGSHNKQRLFP